MPPRHLAWIGSAHRLATQARRGTNRRAGVGVSGRLDTGAARVSVTGVVPRYPEVRPRTPPTVGDAPWCPRCPGTALGDLIGSLPDRRRPGLRGWWRRE